MVDASVGRRVSLDSSVPGSLPRGRSPRDMRPRCEVVRVRGTVLERSDGRREPTRWMIAVKYSTVRTPPGPSPLRHEWCVEGFLPASVQAVLASAGEAEGRCPTRLGSPRRAFRPWNINWRPGAAPMPANSVCPVNSGRRRTNWPVSIRRPPWRIRPGWPTQGSSRGQGAATRLVHESPSLRRYSRTWSGTSRSRRRQGPR